MSVLVHVASTDEIPLGRAIAVEVQGRRIAIFNLAGIYSAIRDTCPHQSGPLSQGRVERSEVICPWHAARFDIHTGIALCSSRFGSVPSYPLAVEGNDIKIDFLTEQSFCGKVDSNDRDTQRPANA